MALNASKNISEAEMLGFDCKHMDWSRYMLDVHIPGLLKYACNYACNPVLYDPVRPS